MTATIELKNEYLTVQFKTLGGQLTSIKDKDGLEYLWQADPEYWNGQAPILFPICGSLRNDWAIYIPQESPFFTGLIRRHGFVRKEEFTLKEVNENSVTFSIKPNAEILDNYLYQFELRVVYTLNGKSIRTEFQVTNMETEKTMPYFIGAHPAFNCPLVEGEKYEDYSLEFSEVESCSIPKSFPETGLLDLQDRTPFLENQKSLDLDYSLFSHDAITLDRLKSRSVTLRLRKSGKGLRVDFDDFPNLILWSTTNKSPFIALEPWSGLSTSLEEGNILEDKRQNRFNPQTFKDFNQCNSNLGKHEIHHTSGKY